MSQAMKKDYWQQVSDDRLSFEVLETTSTTTTTTRKSFNNTGRSAATSSTSSNIFNMRNKQNLKINKMVEEIRSLNDITEEAVSTTHCLQHIKRRRSKDYFMSSLNHRPANCLLYFFIISSILSIHLSSSHVNASDAAASGQAAIANKVSKVANKLQSSGARFVKKLDLAKSSGQINDWLVHQVAPAMATKIIDNVLQAPTKSGGKKSKSILEFDTNSKSPQIDTQALADKIVDKLADGIKKRNNNNNNNKYHTSQINGGNTEEELAANTNSNNNQVASSSSNSEETEERSQAVTSKKPTSSTSRRGKSLVSDSVHQVVQNLFARDNRKFFGRAMEKSKLPLRSALQSLHNSSSSSSSNSWLVVKEPLYDQHLFVSTDSSQLDENPVVLRAEHGHNLTTVSPLQQPQQNYQNQRQESHHHQQQNISPLISSLMSNPSTNQMGNKLLQKHRLQQKYVHTNRHQQQHLSPKPWPSSNNGQQQHNRRHQQQSPYSLPVTSDMNIVSAPSSPAPPPIQTLQPTSTTMPTTSTTTTSTTPNPPPSTFSFVPPTTVTQVSPIKFKFNNRHSQYPGSSSASSLSNSISAQSWYSNNNRNHPYNPQHHPSSNHRFQHHHPSTTSTTSTTTTTTTTTTTPEPPPQTEAALVETMDSLLDMDQQTSSPVSSILSSVAQTALDSLSQSSPFTNSNSHHHSSLSPSSSSNHEDYTSYNSNNNSSYSSQSSSSPLSSSSSSSSHSGASIKGASPSTTSARHSIISAEAIPTALGAPLYHLTRANFTATSIMSPPPRRSGPNSPAAKVAVQYFQKGLNNMASTIFGRQSKNWAKRLGISSVLLSGLLYGAAILANPGAPLPTNGFEVLQALTKNKRRRGARESLIPPLGDSNSINKFASPITGGPLNAALLDNNVNILYQQPQLIPILEHLIQQEQLQQQQNSLFSQRSYGTSPIEIESIEPDQMARRASTSQFYTLQAMPENYNNYYQQSDTKQKIRKRR